MQSPSNITPIILYYMQYILYLTDPNLSYLKLNTPDSGGLISSHISELCTEILNILLLKRNFTHCESGAWLVWAEGVAPLCRFESIITVFCNNINTAYF
jgi:hypothetical protein